jgi:aerobic-type carbon monoxide dehydrogenase small subunit (CoxS/CutS family)
MTLTINGVAHQISIAPFTPLVEVLRALGFKGTKLGCASGECGACTVIVEGQSVCACLFPVGRVGERNVETIEGVGSAASPHRLQRTLHEMGAFQCGFCTPGVVMSLLALVRATPRPSDEQVRVALQGNVCRCSGYKKLREAMARYIEETP